MWDYTQIEKRNRARIIGKMCAHEGCPRLVFALQLAKFMYSGFPASIRGVIFWRRHARAAHIHGMVFFQSNLKATISAYA
jgi:hypothetical protein